MPKIFSLSSNIELITAIANDISFDKIFSYQLKSLAQMIKCAKHFNENQKNKTKSNKIGAKKLKYSFK